MTGDAVGLITNVLREHTRGGILFEDKKGFFYRCKCGEPTYVESGAPGFAEHVAGAVDAALGGLTRQWTVRNLDGLATMQPHAGEPPVKAVERTRDLFSREPRREIVVGWVGGWTAVGTPEEAP